MNVVGRVGSLISQGVYSVATPFHPFGGAVDIIVVQQEDGTFRSTPWYVRFGKFQGVLKGAEKVVGIHVNGVEANFHMYLENTGEAFFVREVDPNNTDSPLNDCDSVGAGEEDGNLDTDKSVATDMRTISLTKDAQSLVEGPANQLERAESDSERRFYEFQDEQSSMESEYGSTRFENLEDVENLVEPELLDSEVILVSVDGHILTAPISSAGDKTEDVQLCTPQFHLGPGKQADLCEDDVTRSGNVDACDANCPSDRGKSTSNVASGNTCCCQNDVNVSSPKFEFSERKECVNSTPFGYDHEYNHENMILENHIEFDNSPKNAPCSTGRGDTFRNCLELAELTKLIDHTDAANVVSEAEIHNHQRAVRYEDVDTVVADSYEFSQSLSIVSDGRLDEGLCLQQVATRSIGVQTDRNTRLEISLCRDKLHTGMGSMAAAEVFDAHCISEEVFRSSAASIIRNDNLVVRYRERYLSWEKAAEILLGMAAFGIDLPVEPEDVNQVIAVERDETQTPKDDAPEVATTSSGRRWRLWPIAFRRAKTLGHSNSDTSNEALFADPETTLQRSLSVHSTAQENDNVSTNKHLIKTHNPTTEQMSSLNLMEGQNTITFSFSTRVLGTQQVDAHIYLWKWNTRIVISDVDGTITRSDVLGQFMPLVGRDWTQSGVARLFSAIKENGYQLLFLSARAIVQAYLTRNFLLNLKQDGKALPNGPVVISPDGLFPSLYREVIRRAPHEFKIACLEDIRALFPADYNPFYAGFGNRDTDELSYLKIGIPKGKIYIINPKGEVAINHRVDVKSYTSLHTLVNDMFPPTSMVEQEDFNSWNFWKMPLPDVDM